MKSYQELDSEYFRTGRKRRKYANNTWLLKEDDVIKVIYHETAIVTITPENEFTLYNGGYYTKSTMERMNWFSPAPIGTRSYRWFIEESLVNIEGEVKASTKTKYFNGVKLNLKGQIIGKGECDRYAYEKPTRTEESTFFGRNLTLVWSA